MSLRVVIAEDDVLLREGLQALLSRFGHAVLAALPDATRLAEVIEQERPDIVVLDVRMPPSFSDEGIRAALAVRAADPSMPVLVLSQYVEQTYAAELLKSGGGAVGYLLKERVGRVTDFVQALENVAAGGTVVDSEVVRQLLRRRPDPVSRLTARERDVLELMAAGRSNAAIARALVVSDAAVSKHIGNIFSKLELPPDEDDHRRVRAVLALLGAGNSVGHPGSARHRG
jgi:DNA-binding NarL/FixJ family response regulator